MHAWSVSRLVGLAFTMHLRLYKAGACISITQPGCCTTLAWVCYDAESEALEGSCRRLAQAFEESLQKCNRTMQATVPARVHNDAQQEAPQGCASLQGEAAQIQHAWH